MVSAKFNLGFASSVAGWALALCVVVVFHIQVRAQSAPTVGDSRDQLSVKTRMARFPITALNELDLRWLGSPPQIPTNSLARLDASLFESSVLSSNHLFLPKVAGILRRPSYFDVMSVVDQNPDAEIYFAPRVSITNGHPFWVKFLALDYDGQIASAVPKTVPIKVKRILQVTPEFSTVDQSMIGLSMVLPVLDHLGEGGFDRNGSPSQKHERGPNNDSVDNQTCFELRETRVAVEVHEGETLLLFGALSPIHALEQSSERRVGDESYEFVQTTADAPIEAAIVFITPKLISTRLK